jgi:integrase
VIERADELLGERDEIPLPARLSAHKLRHTYASILVACSEDFPYVVAQMGHSDERVTLRLYTHMMRRRDGERERLRALVAGEDWREFGHSIGTRTASEGLSAGTVRAPETTETPALQGIEGVGAVGAISAP